MKEKRLTQRDIDQLYRLREKIDRISARLESEGKNHTLSFGDNGDVCVQLSCAAAALDTILQEY